MYGFGTGLKTKITGTVNAGISQFGLLWLLLAIQEGGTYILSPMQTKRISLPNANASRVLDEEQAKVEKIYAAYGAEQLRMMQKDKKINGKK